MSFIDKAKDAAGDLAAKAKDAMSGSEDKLGKAGDVAAKGVDKLGDLADKATGGKYSDKIDAATDKVERMVDKDGSAGTKST